VIVTAINGEIVSRTTNTPEWEQYILDKGNALLQEFGLDEKDWTIKMIDEDGFNAGRCFHRPRVIILSRDFLLDTDIRNVKETILHEIAHALEPNGLHNQAWYDRLIEIGGTGEWHTSSGRINRARVTD